MSSFTCRCGSICEDDARRDSDYAAYPLSVLAAAESRIAAVAAQFHSLPSSERSMWLATHFGKSYPANEPDQAIIEDLVSRELNVGFVPMFRCAACGRIACFDSAQAEWRFYVSESENA